MYLDWMGLVYGNAIIGILVFAVVLGCCLITKSAKRKVVFIIVPAYALVPLTIFYALCLFIMTAISI